MSWESIFTNVGNILKLITLVGPLIEFIELLFRKLFPGEKKGEEKKAIAMMVGRSLVPPDVTEKEFSDLIDGYVDLKNQTREFTHVDTGF